MMNAEEQENKQLDAAASASASVPAEEKEEQHQQQHSDDEFMMIECSDCKSEGGNSSCASVSGGDITASSAAAIDANQVLECIPKDEELENLVEEIANSAASSSSSSSSISCASEYDDTKVAAAEALQEQDGESIASSKFLPGQSAFHLSQDSNSHADEIDQEQEDCSDSIFSQDWDYVSQLIGGPGFEAIETLVERLAASANEINDQPGQRAIIHEIANFGSTLDRFLQVMPPARHNSNTSSRSVPKQANEEQPKQEEQKQDQEQNNTNNEDEKNQPLQVLFRALQHRHVVQAIQEFLYQPVVADLIVDVARTGSEGNVHCWQTASLQHVGDILSALASLVKAAPELVTLVPLTIQYLTSGFRSSYVAESVPEAAPVASEAPAPTPEPVVIHRYVLCDGCDTSEKKQKSREEGNTCGKYIAGIRWKSAIIEDFDICSSCESTGLFEEKYGPFLKITKPAKAPKELVVVLRPDQQDPQDQLNGSSQQQQQQRSRNHQYRPRRWCRGGPPQRNPQVCPRPVSVGSVIPPTVAPAVPVSRPPAPGRATMPTAPPASSENEEKLVNCPRGHVLKKFNAFGGFTCDACEKSVPFGTFISGCRTCNFDLCNECLDAQVPSVPKKEQQETPQQETPQEEEEQVEAQVDDEEEEEEAQQQQTVVPPTPAGIAYPAIPPATTVPVALFSGPLHAKFLRDVSLPDGTNVAPGSRLTKTWKIHNPGQESWPEGVRLVNVGGEVMGAPQHGVVVSSIGSKQSTDVSIELVAPERPGRYVGYYRLVGPDDRRFGHRLWVDVNVRGPNLVPGQQQPQQEQVSASWEYELHMLCDMGFNDIEKNRRLLVEEKGNMERVVARLFR